MPIIYPYLRLDYKVAIRPVKEHEATRQATAITVSKLQQQERDQARLEE
jgi:hypothetical protein